ncbi:hypothetical protein A1O1_03497 [Capronia coronata CBS 617.96]|uniref:Uncharacterized protein n=1 Tax=Capronia coronata CBS 617.96 TaxID=1182541 RepID=W9YMF1_9EURO|nr:uncharacterized protein A1O1_03497 [Capronia coronata CBS 617.96]EXJ90396.1 hypothetical protein A1O1_03497 [Capronia coronata CBS 617.96]
MESPMIAEDNPIQSNNHDATAVSPNPLRCPPPQYQPSVELNYPLAPPLGQISPERLNQQRIPLSPSLHSYLAENDRPRNRDSMTSDVQTKIALLNSLAANPGAQASPTRAPRGVGGLGLNGNSAGGGGAVLGGNGATTNVNDNSALQQAVMGYEEAQASLASITAELERAREELTSRKKRERLLSQRVEDLLEELQAEKQKRARDQESYSKEIKRCRKEGYRAELAVVESRQDLQEVRAELKRCQAEVQHEKAEKEKSRQESFERAYALAGTVGEVDQLKDRLKAIEQERDAALLEAKTIAMDKPAIVNSREATEPELSQMDGATSWAPWEDDGNETPYDLDEPTQSNKPLRLHAPVFPSFESIRFHLDYFDKKVEGVPVTPQEQIQFLKQELGWARRQHAEDADMIHFMHMQCQFKACPCRLAEKKGERFIHDHAYEASLQQERSSKKRKISMEPAQTAMPARNPAEEPNMHSLDKGDRSAADSPQPETAERQGVELPPDPTPEVLERAREELPLLLEEASEIPLPEAQPMELATRDETPEPTAQLEEITQVLVEPGTSSKPFSFSTSTTSNPALRATTQSPRHTETASETMEQELFDLSPPKHAPPRRPSTAMGILAVDSPIRLVPDSPRSVRASRRDHHNDTQSMTTTTKVALKGSPSRESQHRRAQSRPILPSPSPLVSSVMSHVEDEGRFTKETSASPAPNTLFPVTPLHKHSRSMHNFTHGHQSLQQTQPNNESRSWNQSPPQTIATTTTTIRVPLRGFEDADEPSSPERDGILNTHRYGYEHAHTEVLNVNMDMSTMTIDHSFTNPIRPLQNSSTSILGNIPGTPISREAALAQIRARRDRARSINLKRSTDGNSNGTGNLGKGAMKSPTKPKAMNALVMGGLFARDKENAYGKREISQASAPGRFAG